MCGIAGYFSEKTPIRGLDFYEAFKKIKHRGPDDEGFALIGDTIELFEGDMTVPSLKTGRHVCGESNIYRVLSHARLSILDLSEAGHQPMMDSNWKYAIVYNGEIYNYKELREELEKEGYIFKSDCDTEIVLYSYICWGMDCFDKFNGMWAIALYELENNRVILSRDRFGIKPLFYYHKNDKLIFASEIKFINSLSNDLSINCENIEKYVKYNYLCDDEGTLFANVREVKPASTMIFDLKGNVSTLGYWKYKPHIVKRSFDDALEEFTDIFEDAIRIRMRSDVEIGSLLSGGLDSNTIIASMKHKGYLNDNFEAFSSVYLEKEYSEEKYIEDSKKKIGIKVDFVNMDSDKVARHIDEAIYYCDMPIRSASIVLQNLLYEEISRVSDVKVVLNGQGADELFGGYIYNYYTRFGELLCNFKLLQAIEEIKKFAQNRKIPFISILKGIYGQRSAFSLFDSNIFNEVTFEQIVSTPLREYLMYDDRQSMAHGIEARAPFMDYRLVEFAFSLNSDYKVNKDYNKLIVRAYAQDKVVESIVERKDKMGFTSPQILWQRTSWKQILDEEFSYIEKNGLFDLNKKDILYDYRNYQKNGSGDPWIIWRWFALSRWRRLFI